MTTTVLVAEVVAASLTGSLALLADAGHPVARDARPQWPSVRRL